MTIYIDIVLIENLIMNYIILFTTAVVLKIKVNHIRLILASLLGAGYSIIAYMGIIKVYSSIILKIILSALIIYISFNPQNIKKMCKDLLLFKVSFISLFSKKYLSISLVSFLFKIKFDMFSLLIFK